MVKQIARYVWNGEVTLELQNLNLAVSYDEVKRGGRTVRVFKPTDWLDEKGNIIFDSGKRLKGWFIQQARTVKPSLADILRHGIKCNSIPTQGQVPVAKISDISPNKNFLEKDKLEYYLSPETEKIGYPFKEVFSVPDGSKKRSVFSFHYVINKPIIVKVKIHSFARGFLPETAKEMLNKLGPIMGLGDGYAQGYGCFEMKDFTFNIQELNI